MKKILISVLLACSLCFAWYPREEYHAPLHFGISLVSTVGSYLVLSYIWPRASKHVRVGWAIPMGLTPGLGKEIYDEFYRDGFDGSDMIFNALGVLVGTSVNSGMAYKFILDGRNYGNGIKTKLRYMR